MRPQLPARPNDAPLLIPFSSDARYWRLVELPKFHVLDVAPSLTTFALKPSIPALTHRFGSLVVKTRGRRWAPSDPANNITVNKDREMRFIILLQVVLRFARSVG